MSRKIGAVADLKREGYGSRDRPLTKDLWLRDSRPACAAMSESGDYIPKLRHVDYRRYYDPAFATLEFERMWTKNWLLACREEDLPNIGDRLPFDVGSLSFIIIRAENDQFHAFYNSCPHRGTKLCEHKSSGATIKCPFHFWEWKPNGDLKQIPSYWDFADLDRRDTALRKIRVERWGGYIMINCDPDARSLLETLSVIPSHFANFDSDTRYTAAHFRKIVTANWKVAMEAFQEAYHLPAVHPQAVPFSADSQSKYDVWSAGGGHIGRVVTPSAVPGMAAEPEASSLTASQAYAQNVKQWRHTDAELPVLKIEGDLRAQLAQWHRDIQKEAYGRTVVASDSVMLDAMLYYVFPNIILWLSETVPFMYRFLPHATDPELSYFEARMLLPTCAGGTPPAPSACVEIGDDERIADKMPAFGFTANVLDQDMENMLRVQQGAKCADPKRQFSQLGRYQEKVIQRWHELLGEYVSA